jgi:hypothetical protein
MSAKGIAIWGCWLFLLAVPAPGAGAQVAWDDAFPTASAPPNVYFQARYRDGRGDSHRLEVWREGGARLRRKTDDAIDFSVERDPSGGYVYRLVDRARQTVVVADRAMLYRMGLFSDWRGLAHVLDLPRGEFRIAPSAQAPNNTAHGPCAWFRLEITEPSPSVSEICWSRGWGLPLIVRTGGTADPSRFVVEDVRTFLPDAATFTLPREGLLRLDVGPEETPLD